MRAIALALSLLILNVASESALAMEKKTIDPISQGLFAQYSGLNRWKPGNFEETKRADNQINDGSLQRLLKEKKDRIDINATAGASEYTALLGAIQYASHPGGDQKLMEENRRIILTLIKAGADVNKPNAHHHKPLQVAEDWAQIYKEHFIGVVNALRAAGATK